MWIGRLVLMLLVCAAPARADFAATLGQLNSNDPAERESARMELLALAPGSINDLLEVARASPLSPQQLAMLREVTIHLLVKSSNAENDNPNGQIGIRAPAQVALGSASIDGAAIATTLQGFDAFRVFRPGDRIIALGPVGQGNRDTMRIRSFQELRAVVGFARPGQKLGVIVVRNGREIGFDVEISPRPPGIDNVQQDIHQAWVNDATRRWETQIAPTLRVTRDG